MTEAIGDMYGGESEAPSQKPARPLSFAPSSHEKALEQKASQLSKLSKSTSADSNETIERHPSSPNSNGSPPAQRRRQSSINANGGQITPADLSRSPSSDTATQQFPLNDIDYESSPAAVAQELNNLQAIRRMSMNVDANDPDLPDFNSGFRGVPTVPPSHSADENDASRLFWVPARIHPELAPKEFNTFVEDRVDRIKRRSGDDEGLSPHRLERGGSGGSTMNRRKSMLSKTIEVPSDYKDGAEVLEKKKSIGAHSRKASAETSLHELEHIVNDPTSLVRTMSLEQSRNSLDANSEDDAPILPQAPEGQTLKRSTRTTYRKGSLRRGERIPMSKRAAVRKSESDDVPSVPALPQNFPKAQDASLSRVQTEPMRPRSEDSTAPTTLPNRSGRGPPSVHQAASLEDMRGHNESRQSYDQDSRPQPKPFQSRIARNGRTTAPLPGYVPPDSVPQIIETPPESDPRHLSLPGTSSHQRHPERTSSHEFSRTSSLSSANAQRIARRISPDRQTNRQTLDQMAQHPSAMPGTNTNTDALSFIPTFADEKKSDKKRKDKDSTDSSTHTKKSGWGWMKGSGEKEKDKEKKEKEEKDSGKKTKSKFTGKSSEKTHDNVRLDVLNQASDGSKGRESMVFDRDNVRLDEERKKESSRKSGGGGADSKKEKEPGIFSSLFGGGRKKGDRDSGGGRKSHAFGGRDLSPDPPQRILMPDVDYNWSRFSILEERAIYRMAHMKLANPRRALYSQVLLSNFMYSYLAKVQQMHPQIQIPQFAQKSQQQNQKQEQQQQQQPESYQQWAAYQAVSAHRSHYTDYIVEVPSPLGRACESAPPTPQSQFHAIAEAAASRGFGRLLRGYRSCSDVADLYKQEEEDTISVSSIKSS